MILGLCTVLLLTPILTDAQIDIHATSQDYEVGSKILLLCKVNTEAECTWLKDDEEIDEDWVESKKLDETLYQLTIKSAVMDDMGRYTCNCKFDSGLKNSTDLMIYVYQRPTFAKTATYYEFLEGDVAVVPCSVTGQPQVEVKWKKNLAESNVTTDSDARIKVLEDSSLQINGIQREDHGAYSCVARIPGRPISETLVISVVVTASPKVWIQESEKSVLEGPENNVSIVCLVTGEPTPNITWSSPMLSNTSHYTFNSDKSELTITSVDFSDNGEYICTARNKIGAQSASFKLNVLVHPIINLTTESMEVKPGHPASVTCQVIGQPTPTITWIKKNTNEKLTTSSGRVKAVGSTLRIEKVEPSDGGLYTCMAHNTAGNDSKDFTLETWPDTPAQVTINAGTTSVTFSPTVPVVNGGSSITNYILEWKEEGADEWIRTLAPFEETVSIPSLKPSTSYSVRMAAHNRIGQGEFSSEYSIRTLPNVVEPSKSGMGKAGMVGIVMLIFVVMLVAVDATCCYTNNCGVLMFLAVKLLGRKAPKDKGLEQVNGEISTIILPPSSKPSTEA
ncbi:neural cell adhesion molecule 1-like [Brienomyrus brachyistius]|uniref:neural cell adhesion molecule 1-like n=1 Tax=Brienomyrus brachyistius TaxID=42636 RepID=UPI0020B3AFB6|nr:neural cell adhesion molecule 1-like [Brienomyrus brachyistius]XP_048883131.1 neural cell adhesion molecule 1-like [Brienomyrus brachyistius]